MPGNALCVFCRKSGNDRDGYSGPTHVRLQLFDSKCFADDGRIVSVSFDGNAAGIKWSQEDPDARTKKMAQAVYDRCSDYYLP